MDELELKGSHAKRAAFEAAALSESEKNKALERVCVELKDQASFVLEQNARDLEGARSSGSADAFLDRLALNPKRIQEMVDGLEQLILLPDPVGEIIGSWRLENGLSIRKQRVPIGVIGIIYEARPNVTLDAAALCLKAGNAVVLRGSSSAQLTNLALVAVIREALSKAGLPIDLAQIIEDPSRDVVKRFLKLKSYLDVVIPRGGAELIRFTVENATVPVLETGAGNCHIYIDQGADYDMAARIVLNAKTQRPAVCNTAETLLVHKDWAGEHLQALLQALSAAGVECRCCERSQALVPGARSATEKDWETEFLDLILAVRVVESLEEAIAHVNRYGTRHSEAIVTNSAKAAERFMQGVDAAAIYHNASTRFTDGFVFGFGAEIGISTQKLHARGPMGLTELTTYKYLVSGVGQIRS